MKAYLEIRVFPFHRLTEAVEAAKAEAEDWSADTMAVNAEACTSAASSNMFCKKETHCIVSVVIS